MSEDEKINILLREYDATAANLVKGVNVCPETLGRYHGARRSPVAHQRQPGDILTKHKKGAVKK